MDLKVKVCLVSQRNSSTVIFWANFSLSITKWFDSVRSGVCGQPEQDPAHPGHPSEEPDQTHRVPQQVPERSHRRRAIQRREDLPYQTDPRPQEAHPAGCMRNIRKPFECVENV